MNTQNTFEVNITYMNEDFIIELNSSLCTSSDILENLQEMKKERFEQESGEDFEADFEDDFMINWLEVPNWLQDLELLEELLPILDSTSYDLEVFEAGIAADVEICNIEEAYSGEFDSDKDFAENMADELGLISCKNMIDKDSQSWPFNCIDWDYAAKELMYDYNSANGYYFRSL